MTSINVITIIITGCLGFKGVKEDVGSSSDILLVGVVSLTRMAVVVGEGVSSPSVSNGGSGGSVVGSLPMSLKSFASSAIPLNIVKTSDLLSLNRL